MFFFFKKRIRKGIRKIHKFRYKIQFKRNMEKRRIYRFSHYLSLLL